MEPLQAVVVAGPEPCLADELGISRSELNELRRKRGLEIDAAFEPVLTEAEVLELEGFRDDLGA